VSQQAMRHAGKGDARQRQRATAAASVPNAASAERVTDAVSETLPVRVTVGVTVGVTLRVAESDSLAVAVCVVDGNALSDGERVAVVDSDADAVDVLDSDGVTVVDADSDVDAVSDGERDAVDVSDTDDVSVGDSDTVADCDAVSDAVGVTEEVSDTGGVFVADNDVDGVSLDVTVTVAVADVVTEGVRVEVVVTVAVADNDVDAVKLIVAVTDGVADDESDADGVTEMVGVMDGVTDDVVEKSSSVPTRMKLRKSPDLDGVRVRDGVRVAVAVFVDDHDGLVDGVSDSDGAGVTDTPGDGGTNDDDALSERLGVTDADGDSDADAVAVVDELSDGTVNSTNTGVTVSLPSAVAVALLTTVLGGTKPTSPPSTVLLSTSSRASVNSGGGGDSCSRTASSSYPTSRVPVCCVMFTMASAMALIAACWLSDAVVLSLVVALASDVSGSSGKMPMSMSALPARTPTIFTRLMGTCSRHSGNVLVPHALPYCWRCSASHTHTHLEKQRNVGNDALAKELFHVDGDLERELDERCRDEAERAMSTAHVEPQVALCSEGAARASECNTCTHSENTDRVTRR
jgi:hypothetical protein